MKSHSPILLLLLLLLTSLPSGASTPYLDLVDEADKACSEGHWEEAEHKLLEAIEYDRENPGNILLMSNLGLIRYNLGKDSLALDILTEAHRKAPSSVVILSNRARVLTSMGHDEDALADYELIMDLDSAAVNARFNHAMLLMRHHRYNEAKSDLEYLVRHFPTAEETMIGNATMHCTMGEYEEALPYYNELLRNAKEADYLGGRALCNLMTGRLQEASDDIAEALHLTPDDGELYLYRAALNKMRFRPADADADARRAVELGVDPARVVQYIQQ